MVYFLNMSNVYYLHYFLLTICFFIAIIYVLLVKTIK